MVLQQLVSSGLDEMKRDALVALLKDKFEVEWSEGYTLLTVFNYSDSNSELSRVINKRDIALEQRSSSALQLLLVE